MLVKEFNRSVYFCTNLIEIIKRNPERVLNVDILRRFLKNYDHLACLQCHHQGPDDDGGDCTSLLFDVDVFKKAIKLTSRRQTGKFKLNNPMISGSGDQQQQQQHSLSYLFYTQNDADYYQQAGTNATSSSLLARSQYNRLNSILDAFENVGYYGFVTFRAVIQRTGCVRMDNIIFNLTQKTQPTTQATSQMFQSQMNSLRLVVVLV
jgi:hypothetical protein